MTVHHHKNKASITPAACSFCHLLPEMKQWWICQSPVCVLHHSGSLRCLLCLWVECLGQAKPLGAAPGTREGTTCLFSFLSFYRKRSSLFPPQRQMLWIWGQVVWSEAGRGGCSAVPGGWHVSEVRVGSLTSGMVLPLASVFPRYMRSKVHAGLSV